MSKKYLLLHELMDDFVRLNDLIARSIAAARLDMSTDSIAHMETALYKSHEIMRKIHTLKNDV